ncbi:MULTISPECIES: transporter [Tenacibaculum]|uniref:transporter n=1 Tax=Tenacibaculum TaxID=104267 RepID=UPI001F0B4B4F|nr:MULTISPECIES: transporter [Tenacibaculum]MCH3881357.1 transporter [Tenacibaculum aquimarinum]MCH3883782.1 transporter [Tenacibaculum aquimarinum]MDO6599049.1 transporter [Tenacibaculum sp. 1_MG-2023]
MKKIITLSIFLITLSIFSQSPWTQKKGKAYTQLSFTSISQYESLFGNPSFNTERKITDNTLRLYAAYGISNKTTFFAALPIKTVKSEELVASTTTPITSSASVTSTGNILFGIKHNFYNNKWLITGQISAETKSTDYNASAGLRTGYDAWTFTPLISIGRGFNSWYLQAYTGIDFRTNDYSSSLKMGGEMGYNIASWFTIIGFADGLASFTNGEVIIPQENSLTGLYVDKQSYAAFGLKTIFKVNEEFGVNLGAGLAFGGRRVAKKPAVTGGIYFKFL